MRNSFLFCISAATLLLAWSCKQTEDIIPLGTEGETQTVITNAGYPEEGFTPGIVNVKVSPDFASSIEACTDGDGQVDVSKVKSMGFAVKDLGILSMGRLFPYAGEFEGRTREAGLHLWYTIRYDVNQSVTKAGNSLGRIDGINVIDYCPIIIPAGGNEVLEYVTPESVAPSASSSYVFNDPLFPTQWHYYNDGSMRASQSGCDINVVPVWKNYTTGKEDVIVSVVDGGIDYEHEDLADNMWHDPSDQRHVGFNFCTNNYVITAYDHGTHVAGTIAAVNNNGKGVCGIAGGDASKGQKGVKLMSCQIFSNKDGGGSGEQAIKWGADHGAVISQNSWGYKSQCSTPRALEDAVNYFTKYAGYDAKGTQTGPMAGGLVIFAAGNDDSSKPYGADSENMLTVTSVGADFCRAYYSNYGDWCDIAAPGGDVQKGNQVVSTLPGNQYGKMQGTSMACPHVSGVAALVLSKKGGKGYTSQALREALVNHTTNISAYTRTTYMGTGLVNAYLAVAGSGGKAPDKVEDFSLDINSNNILVSIKVPTDADDGKPNSLYAYYSTSPISSTEGLKFSSIYVGDAEAGDYVTGKITNLDFSTKYYVAVVACDLSANLSALSKVLNATTGINHSPVITPAGPVELTLKRHETKQVKFTYADTDEHYLTVALEKANEAERLDTTIMDKPFVEICATGIEAGNYTSNVVVSDQYGLSTKMAINYTVLANNPPRTVKTMPDMVFGKRGETVTLNESDYFTDEDGEQLSYSITNSDESVINVNYSKGVFYATSMGYGYAQVTVTASDCLGKTASQTFKVLVRDGNEALDVYPNPVVETLYVRTGEIATADIKVISASGSIVFDKNLTISPFEPAKLDFTGVGAGVYTVRLDYNGNTITKNIVKI